MRQTLFLIPHQIAGLPVFGFGWLLIGLAIAVVLRIAWAVRRGQSIRSVVSGEGLMWGIVAAAIAFLLPRVELANVDGDPVGMAVRGYGVMLLLAVSASVALAAYRASRRGIDPDVIFSMAPWAFIGGIAGARLFYIIQYWDTFPTYASMLRFTEGGLVVYGSFIGGGLAVVYYIIKHRLPLLKFGDVIVPVLFIGVFFGRVGCLMNGCCYGGACTVDHWAAIEFPPASVVYKEQLRSGRILGIERTPGTGRIESVQPGSLAAQAGIQAPAELQSLTPVREADPPKSVPASDVRYGLAATIDGQFYQWSAAELPSRAMPVVAAQLISSVSSLALCLMLCGLSLVFRREGMVMMIGFASYAVLRFMLELVRVDEAGQFGTNFSISQWVSIIVFALSVVGLGFVLRRDPLSSPSAQPTTG